METKTVTVYRYQELSDKAKERVRKDSQEMFNMDCNDLIKEAIEQRLDKEGLSGLKDQIRFSLGYTQGDGVSFLGDVDLKEFIKAQGYEAKTAIPDFVSANIYSNSNHYVHYNTMEIESDLDDVEIGEVDDFEEYTISQVTYDEIQKLIDYVLEKCKDISQELASEGYDIIEHEESEENMIEMSDINEWRFFKNGDMYCEWMMNVKEEGE